MRPRRLADARWLADLSPAQAKALPRYGDGTVTSAGGPAGAGVHRATHGALLGAGLVEQGENAKGESVWRPTEHGWRVLRTAEPRLLARRSDALYAVEPGEAMGGSADPGEGVDEATLREFARESGVADQLRRGQVAEELVAERRALTVQLAKLKALAFERGADVRDDVRIIQQRIAMLEALAGIDRLEVPRREAA